MSPFVLLLLFLFLLDISAIPICSGDWSCVDQWCPDCSDIECGPGQQCEIRKRICPKPPPCTCPSCCPFYPVCVDIPTKPPPPTPKPTPPPPKPTCPPPPTCDGVCCPPGEVCKLLPPPCPPPEPWSPGPFCCDPIPTCVPKC